MDEDKSIDARASQGYNDHPENVEQQFGDRKTQNSAGGDIADRDVDKRSGNFINNLYCINFDIGHSSLEQLQPLRDGLENLIKMGHRNDIEKDYADSLPKDNVFLPDVAAKDINIGILKEFGKLGEFGARLVENPNIPKAERDQLKQELDKINISENQTQPFASPTSEKKVENKPKPYLLIVSEPIDNEEFLVNGWLFFPTIDQPATASQFVALDLEAGEKGTSCCFEEVPEVINQFLGMIKKDRPRYLQGCQLNQLTIEVFVPARHFSKTVETLWTVKVQSKQKPISVQYKFALRSYERTCFEEYLDDRWDDWKENWEKMQAICKCQTVREIFEDLKHTDALNWMEIELDLKNKAKKTGFIIPHLPSDEEAQANFFKDLSLETSAPVSIWFRHPLEELNQEELIAFLKKTMLANLQEGIQDFRKSFYAEHHKKMDSAPKHFAWHWSIAWEDPTHLPPDVLFEVQEW